MKIGVKVSDWVAYFLVDPFAGADTGTFTVAELFALDTDLLSVWQNSNGSLKGLSRISFFGTTTGESVPEPATLALLGLGLVGLGLARRRKAA